MPATAIRSRFIEHDRLVGGLYGFDFGRLLRREHVPYLVRDASKVALVHLVARLQRGGFTLLDTQFVTDHLAQFGAMEIARREYKLLLRDAIEHRANWYSWPPGGAISGSEILAQIEGDAFRRFSSAVDLVRR